MSGVRLPLPMSAMNVCFRTAGLPTCRSAMAVPSGNMVCEGEAGTSNQASDCAGNFGSSFSSSTRIRATWTACAKPAANPLWPWWIGCCVVARGLCGLSAVLGVGRPSSSQAGRIVDALREGAT